MATFTEVVQDELRGDVAQTVFMTRSSPATPLAVYENGLRLQLGVDYTQPVATSQVTLTNALQVGDVLFADYYISDFSDDTTTLLMLISDLSLAQDDATQTGDLLTEVLRELGQVEWLVTLSSLAVTKGVALYTEPTTSLQLLAAFHDERHLSLVDLSDLESLAGDWRARVGTPHSLVQEIEGKQKFRVVPIPTESSSAAGSNPLGNGFPMNAIHLLYTEQRTAVPQWLTLPVALRTLAREFRRESNHRDTNFADGCEALAKLMLEWVI